MPALPIIAIETEADELLAARHIDGLTWADERTAAACALNMDDETLAESLSLSPGAVRAQRFRAAHKVLDLTGLKPTRVHLGRWCMYHWDCCLVRVARRIEDETWLVA